MARSAQLQSWKWQLISIS